MTVIKIVLVYKNRLNLSIRQIAFYFAASLIRFPTPKPVPLTKPQTSTTVTSSTAPSYATEYQNTAPVYSTIDTVRTSSTSTIDTKPVNTLCGSKTLLVCNKSNMVKIIPICLKDKSSGTLRGMPQKVSEDLISSSSRISSSASSDQSSLEGHPTNQVLQLTSQSCLISNNQAFQKLDNPLDPSSTPAKESSEEDSQCSIMSHENVIFTDHSYTFEMKITPSEKHIDVSKDSSDPANNSGYHMLLKDVLDLGFEQAEGCGTSGAILGNESGEESKAGSHLVKEEMDSDYTELTEDSDMYNDTDSSQFSDKEDLFADTVSE